MNDRQRFEMIMSALLQAQDDGAEIGGHTWGIEPGWRSDASVSAAPWCWRLRGDCVCPLAALLYVSQACPTVGPKTAAATILEVGSGWVAGFLAGFDDYPSMLYPNPGPDKQAGWTVAQRVRQEVGLKRLRWPYP